MQAEFQLHPQLEADTVALGRLSLSRVLLMNDHQYPWIILVPQRAGITEIYQLTELDQLLLNQESVSTGRLLMSHFAGDKLNVAALGNMVPQLHIHHIVRHKSDAAWPKPVWGTVATKAYGKEILRTLVPELTELFSAQIDSFTVC